MLNEYSVKPTEAGQRVLELEKRIAQAIRIAELQTPHHIWDAENNAWRRTRTRYNDIVAILKGESPFQ